MISHTPDRFLRLPEVLKRTSLSRATLYRKIAAGTFPPQVKISERRCGWRESHVTAWYNSPISFTVADLPNDAP